jgi:hypothetical protein
MSNTDLSRDTYHSIARELQVGTTGKVFQVKQFPTLRLPRLYTKVYQRKTLYFPIYPFFRLTHITLDVSVAAVASDLYIKTILAHPKSIITSFYLYLTYFSHLAASFHL